ncbi:hypothetical protein HY990_03075 [Candidatus Micrarchaeota archaeon]|nr:hypothetical protein [Candidatus Micrarchaeota archaeon]
MAGESEKTRGKNEDRYEFEIVKKLNSERRYLIQKPLKTTMTDFLFEIFLKKR